MPISIKGIVQNAVTGVKNTVQTVKSGTGTAIQKAQTILDKGKESAMLALFRPFVPIAKKYLIRKGVTPSNNEKVLVKQIFAASKLKHYGLSEGQTAPDAFDVSIAETETFGLTDAEATALSEGAATQGADISPAMVQIVISFLKTIFETINKKKAAGVPLTPDEQKIADIAGDINEAVEAGKVEASTIDAESQSEAQKLLAMFNWKIALLVLLLIVLFFWMRSRK